MYHPFNRDNVYTDSVYKIYAKKIDNSNRSLEFSSKVQATPMKPIFILIMEGKKRNTSNFEENRKSNTTQNKM